VEPIPLAQPHHPVDLLERGLLDPIDVVALDPQRIVHRDPHEVEAPAGDPPEIVLAEVPVPPVRGALTAEEFE
jgi:hypothetical protein